MNGFIYIFGILLLVFHTETKPNGAPTDSCFYMTPRHIHPHTFRRVFPTKAMGLYNITTSADVFRPDRPIRVTLWGPPFKGFLMVAAEEGAKDWPTGIFYSEDGAAKRISCLGRGDTVTHMNNSYKDSVSVLWYGPENMMSEQVQFIATVVVNLTIYYTNIRSGFLRLDPSIHAAATMDPEAAGAGGENAAPIGVTMDPWLSGQSVTQAPSSWLSGLLGGNVGSNSGWGGSSQTTSGWGSSQGGGGGWGASQGESNWAQSSNTGWGSNQGGQSGSWGSSSNSGWGNQGGGTRRRGGGNSNWGNRGGSGQQNSRGSQRSSADTGGSWGANGDWQQWGQGSVTSSSWTRTGDTQWTNADGSTAWGNGQNWQAPGSGKPIWHWNSGKISTTAAPPAKTQTEANQAGASNSGSAWSISSLLNVLRNAGFG